MAHWPHTSKKDFDVGPVLPELKDLINRLKGPETIWTQGHNEFL